MDSPTVQFSNRGVAKTTRLAQSLKRGLGFFFRSRSRFILLLVGSGISLLASSWCWRSYHFHDHLDQARRAAMDGRTSTAVSHLQFCESIDAEDREVMLLAALVARMAQTWQRAEEVLERYWTRYGDDEQLTFERLLLKAARDDTESVAGLLKTRITQGGDTARLCRQALVSGQIREFRYAEAQATIDAWRAELPSDPLANLLQGRLQEQLFKFQEAAETYGAIVARDPSHHEARLRFVIVLMQQRQAGDALVHLQVLREALPDNSEVAVQWALALRQVGRTGEAISALDEVLSKHPNLSAALVERGTLALNAGDDKLAAELLMKALRTDPGAIGTRNLYVSALTRLGRTDELARELETVKTLTADSDRLTELIHGALQSRPNDPNPPYEIAGIALRAGQPSEAIRWYHTALKRNPNHGPTHLALAVIYQEMGNPVLATQHRALGANAPGRR